MQEQLNSVLFLPLNVNLANRHSIFFFTERLLPTQSLQLFLWMFFSAYSAKRKKNKKVLRAAAQLPARTKPACFDFPIRLLPVRPNKRWRKRAGRTQGERRDGKHQDVLGQQYHPNMSHGAQCQQPSNIIHWLIRLGERRGHGSSRMKAAHQCQTWGEDAVSSYCGGMSQSCRDRETIACHLWQISFYERELFDAVVFFYFEFTSIMWADSEKKTGL